VKRSIIAIALASVCAVPVAANAQGFGVLAGYSYGSAPASNNISVGTLKANDGFAIGIGGESSGIFRLGFNALYSQRGYTSSTPGYSQKLGYIDVPIYVKFNIPTPLISPFILAGPQGSFQISCDAGGGAGSCPTSNKTTYAGILAIGAKFGMLGGLSLQGRYVYGLQNLDYSTVSTASNYKSRSFQLLLGLGF
jgi:hypothetical protein